MAKHSYFEEIGILGWGSLEPIILGAMLSQKSVLLAGPHGCNKTEGCQTISEAVFGEECHFVPYDTSLVNPDDLLGYLSPSALANDKVEYVKTPDSIWHATAILLDEINRCNPVNAAKFFEVVRSRTINGRATGVEFVWAACNPPDKYNTAHMDPAQISRFLVLTTPVFKNLSPAQRKQILTSSTKPAKGSLKDMMDKARKATVSVQQDRSIATMTLKIAEDLNSVDGIQFSGRQVKDLYSLLCNMDRIAQVFEDLDISTNILTRAVMGLVPETSGLCRSSVDETPVRAAIKATLTGFKLSDPVLTAENVVELCKAKIKDASGHAAAIRDMLLEEQDPAMIAEAWKVVKNRTDLNPEIHSVLRQAFAVQTTLISLQNEAKVEDAALVLKKELDLLKPKPARNGRKSNR